MSRVEKVSKINKRDTPYIRQVRVCTAMDIRLRTVTK